MSYSPRKKPLPPVRVQKLQEVKATIAGYADNIQKVIDCQMTGADFARSLDLTASHLVNNAIEKSLHRRYHLYYHLTDEEIHNLLVDTMSPTDRLMRAILGYRSDQFVYLPDDIESKLCDVLKDALNMNEQLVISYRFGFDDEPLTLEETGKRLSLTRERIRQIEAKALRKMRRPCYFQQLVPGHDLRVRQYEELTEIARRIKSEQQELALDVPTDVEILHKYGKLDSRTTQALLSLGVKDIMSLAPYSKLALRNTIPNLGTKSISMIADTLAMFGVTMPEKTEKWKPKDFSWLYLDDERAQIHCTDLESWQHLVSKLCERNHAVQSEFYSLGLNMSPFFNQYGLTIYLQGQCSSNLTKDKPYRFNIDKDESTPVIHWNYSERNKNDKSR